MAIITISRGTFSGGQRLANCLATTLGYRVISRELLAEAAARYGVKEDNLRRGLEQPPTFWDRFRVDRQVYLNVVQAALCHAIRDDDIVYHGNAGHLLLQDVGPVFRVRVIAPMAQRITAAVAAEGCSAEEAAASIAAKDEARVAWTRFLYGVEWRDPALYDLVVSLEKLTLDAACEAIATLVRRPEFTMTDAARARLDNLYLSSHVKAKLFLNPRIGAAASKLEVTASGGAVRLSGVLPGESFLHEVLSTCQALPEVKDVQAEWLGSYVTPV